MQVIGAATRYPQRSFFEAEGLRGLVHVTWVGVAAGVSGFVRRPVAEN